MAKPPFPPKPAAKKTAGKKPPFPPAADEAAPKKGALPPGFKNGGKVGGKKMKGC